MMNADYTMVAEARGQRVLFFRRFGSYQGDWLLLSRDDDLYYLYRDYYGSCSGCDAIEGQFSYDRELTPNDPQVQEFIKSYQPFIEMRLDAALRVAMDKGDLMQVLPRNRREWYDDEWNNAHTGRQLALMVKADQGVLTAPEILEIDNQESRRQALESYGAEEFVRDAKAIEVDVEGADALMRIDQYPQANEPFVFLYLKDASTPRRYILRVDPNHKTVRSARAASFRIPEERFVLAKET